MTFLAVRTSQQTFPYCLPFDRAQRLFAVVLAAERGAVAAKVLR